LAADAADTTLYDPIAEQNSQILPARTPSRPNRRKIADLHISPRATRFVVLTVTIFAFSVSLLFGLAQLFQESGNNRAESKEMISWSTTQAEHEYWRFIETLGRFHDKDNPPPKDDLLLRLDILWSRINITEQGAVGRRILSIDGVGSAIAAFKFTLVEIEPAVIALAPGDNAAIETIRGLLLAHATALYQVSEKTHHFEQNRQFALIDRAARTYLLAAVSFLGVLVTGSVLIFLLMKELKRSRRLLLKATAAENKAHDSEQKFRDYANASSDWFWESDAQFRITHLSEEFFKRNDFRRDAVIGRKFNELGDDNGAMHKKMQSMQASAAHPFRDLRCRWQSAADAPLDLSISSIPIFDGRGQLSGYRGTMSDITERLKIEAQLARTGKMESLGLLTGGVAHEFNNLLSVIGGYADNALSFCDNPTRIAKALGVILQATDRGAGLTRQMLTFARKGELEAETVAVSDTVRDVEEMLRPLAGRSVEVDFNISDRGKFIYIDPGQLSQAVLNLAINARDAMPEGGKLTIGTEHYHFDQPRQIGTILLPPGDYIGLYVADTGKGIAPEVMERIFEPFFTTKGKNKGTGLGLSIIYGLMADSGGAVDVESELGRGSRFTLYLPEAAAPPKEAAA
jgi:PAS domain S-box-containing protein